METADLRWRHANMKVCKAAGFLSIGCDWCLIMSVVDGARQCDCLCFRSSSWSVCHCAERKAWWVHWRPVVTVVPTDLRLFECIVCLRQHRRCCFSQFFWINLNAIFFEVRIKFFMGLQLGSIMVTAPPFIPHCGIWMVFLMSSQSIQVCVTLSTGSS